MAEPAPTAELGVNGNVRLHEEAKIYSPGGVHTAIRIVDPPLCIRRSQGAYLWDEDGKRYIDYHAAFAPIILGHCYPAVGDGPPQWVKDPWTKGLVDVPLPEDIPYVFDVFDRATEHVHTETHNRTLVVTHQHLEGNGELVVCRRLVSLGN